MSANDESNIGAFIIRSPDRIAWRALAHLHCEHQYSHTAQARVLFFLLWPLFARAPRHWFLEIFLLSAPGVQSVFFLLRSVGRRDLSAGPEQKKNTTQGVFFWLRPRGKAGEGEAPCRHGASPSPAFPRGRSQKKKTPWVVFFFCCGPRADAHSLTAGLGSDASPSPGWRLFFCCGAGPDRGGVFFFAVAPPGRSLTHCGPATWRGQSKKKTPPRVFFFGSGPGERRGRRSPVPARGFSFPCLSPGPEPKKKNTLGGVFFLLRPPRGRSPFGGPQQKKKHHFQGFFFFCSGPVPAPNGASPFPAVPGAGAKKKHPGWCFFFALAPCRLPTGLLLPLPFAGAAAKKKHPGWCFFFCSGPVPAPNGASPSPAFPRGRSKKKKHPGWCFFFCCGPAWTLTHSLRAWVAMPPPRRGGVFFFAAAPPGPGWCFFFCCGPARTLTHSLWAGAISARPGWCFFFCCGPAGSF